jgi:galactokinase
MDQAASVLGRSDHVLLLDTGSLEHRHVPLPPSLAFTIVDSGVRRRLEDSAYAERRDEVERAVALLGERRPSEVSAAEAAELVSADPLLSRRLRHVVTENERVREVVEVLERAPVDHGRLGRVLRAGHESLRRDLEVSIFELDLLVDLAYEAGAVAARMMGGGFGGAAIVMVEREDADAVAQAIVEQYRARTGLTATAFSGSAADGARELTAAS